MKKIIILLFLLFVPTSSSANENTASWNLLKNGGK